jgi:alanyl-tRNA synthetase
VRVVEIENVSKELCGGTHVGRTGEIGAFVITGESAVSAGVRRIEAKTGRAAYAFFAGQAGILEAESELLKAPPEQIVTATQHLVAQLKEAQKAVRQLNTGTLAQKAQGLSERAETCEGIKIITEALDDRDYEIDELRAFLDALKKDAPRAVIAVGGKKGDAANIVLFFTKDLVDKGMRIELLVKDINQKLNTRGGGRNQIAQLGGLQSAGLANALEVLRTCAQSFIRNNSKGV